MVFVPMVGRGCGRKQTFAEQSNCQLSALWHLESGDRNLRGFQEIFVSSLSRSARKSPPVLRSALLWASW